MSHPLRCSGRGAPNRPGLDAPRGEYAADRGRRRGLGLRAWRTLAWLLGVRSDPPVELPERDEAGELVGGPRYVARPNPSSPIWQAAEARRRQERRADAQRHWEHVRRLADR